LFQPYAPAPNVPSNNRIMPPPSPSVSNTSSNQSNSANSSANGSGSPHSLPAPVINQQGPIQVGNASTVLLKKNCFHRLRSIHPQHSICVLHSYSDKYMV